MIGSFSYSMDSDVGLDVFIMVFSSLRYRTRTRISSGFFNYRCTYCFSFSLNFLYWSLASICSVVVPKTAPKSSASPLKLRIYDVYAGRLKRLPCPPCTCWLLHSPQLNWPFPRPPLFELDYIMVSWPQVVVVSPPPPLLLADGGTISVSGVIMFPF